MVGQDIQMRCKSCGEEMTEHTSHRLNCGGDCLMCVGEAGDPDALDLLDRLNTTYKIKDTFKDCVDKLMELGKYVELIDHDESMRQGRIVMVKPPATDGNKLGPVAIASQITNELADILYSAGWTSPRDAQWSNLRDVLPAIKRALERLP